MKPLHMRLTLYDVNVATQADLRAGLDRSENCYPLPWESGGDVNLSKVSTSPLISPTIFPPSQNFGLLAAMEEDVVVLAEPIATDPAEKEDAVELKWPITVVRPLTLTTSLIGETMFVKMENMTSESQRLRFEPFNSP